MLIAISDIHFVDGTAGEHNLPFSAFESVFLSDIASLAKEKDAKEVKLLLLGDIIDLIRTTKWLYTDEQDRPWGERGLRDIPTQRKKSMTEKRCLEILGRIPKKSLREDEPPRSLSTDTILHKNWRTFKLFREFGQHLALLCGKKVPVEIIFIPGNHDRLCNLYPTVRNTVREILGLTVNRKTVEGDLRQQWWYKYSCKDEDHGVYARHGHQYDVWNFGGRNDFGRDGHLKTPIGDVFATEFAVKIPWMLESLRAKYPSVTPGMIERWVPSAV